METDAEKECISTVVAYCQIIGKQAHLRQFEGEVVIIVIDCRGKTDELAFKKMTKVKEVINTLDPLQLTDRACCPTGSKVQVGQHWIGNNELTMIAQFSHLDDNYQLQDFLHICKETSIQAIQLLDASQVFRMISLEQLTQIRQTTNMPLILPITNPSQVPIYSKYVNAFHILPQDMQNYSLLRAVGQSQLPIILSRGRSALIIEWLLCAEYILGHGSSKVILCDGGIRTFETQIAYSLDITTIPTIKQLSHIPIIIDTTSITDHQKYETAIVQASIAAGANGLIVTSAFIMNNHGMLSSSVNPLRAIARISKAI